LNENKGGLKRESPRKFTGYFEMNSVRGSMKEISRGVLEKFERELRHIRRGKKQNGSEFKEKKMVFLVLLLDREGIERFQKEFERT
jgi:hypothetical protein